MKKKAIVAIIVAALVALQMPMVAMAEDIKVQINDSNVDTYATGGVISNNVTVKGANAVSISTKEVKIDGNVTEENDEGKFWRAVKVYGEGAGNVEVTGNVTNEGAGNGVYAQGKHTVNIGGSITTAGTQDKAIDASNGATVIAGSVEATGKGIGASDAGTTVDITGIVKTTGTKTADAGIQATNGATVTAGSVEAANMGLLVYGNDTVVVIKGDVTSTGTANGSGACIGFKAPNDSDDQTIPTVVIEGTLTGASTYPLYGSAFTFAKTYVYEIKSTAGGTLKSYYMGRNYIIKTTGATDGIQLSGIKTTDSILGKTYDYANGGDTITVNVKEGYYINSPIATKNADGTYTIIVPNGGGVTIEAIKKVIEKAIENAGYTTPAETGSIGAPVSGTWTQNFKGEWFFTTNRALRNTWAYIADPTGAKEGNWYRFGESGVMLSGWQLINGKWYYFNETPGADLGKLVVNGITPDGKRVGADGARID